MDVSQTKPPFTLSISISLGYALKLLGTYGGGCLTVLGLLVYAPKVYNIVGKRFYRYPIDFMMRVAEKVTIKSLYPVAFIKKEYKESRIIMSHLYKKISGLINSPRKAKIALNFFDTKTLTLDKSKLVQAIQDIVNELVNDAQKGYKLELYRSETNSRKDLIDELIICKFILRLLDTDNEKVTKTAFKKIKNRIFYIVDLAENSENGICNFSVVRSRLEKELKLHNIKLFSSSTDDEIAVEPNLTSKGLETSGEVFTDSENRNHQYQKSIERELLPFHVEAETHTRSERGININLLISAIEAYAFRYHNLDAHETAVNILVKERLNHIAPPFAFIKRFLKWDLRLIGFTEKSQKIGYGIYYEIKDGFLSFSGAVKQGIKHETIVIQIANMRGRILRELWLHGVEAEPEEETLKSRDYLEN